MKKNYLVLLLIGVVMLASCKKKEVENPPVPTIGDEMTIPYVTSFETHFGTYSIYNVVGDQEWVIDYETAKMAGAVKDESGTYVNYENEDWLVSSPVKISGVANAKFSMTYIACYFNDLDRDVNIMVSTDYKAGNQPSTATWTEIPAELVGSYNWDVFNTVEVSLDSYMNQTITIAIKYISDTVKAGTIEVQSISILEGKPSAGGGGETYELPYVEDFSTSFGSYCTKNVVGDQKWVIDYSSAKMAGSVKENGVYVNYENEDWLISSPVNLAGVEKAKLAMNYIACYFGSNLDNDVTLWASTDYTFGEEPSTATWEKVNASWILSYNWDTWNTTEVSLNNYVGQVVTFAVKYLSTTAKAGTIEIKSISIEEGQAGGGGQGGDVQQMPYTQDFSTSFGTYTTYNVDGDEIWGIDYQTAKMTGHVTVGSEYESHANEDWLISSPVELSGSEMIMQVNYIARYFNDINNDITFWISTDYEYNGDPYDASWEQLPTTLTAGSDWTTFATTDIDISEFAGQTAYFAVKYLSTTDDAGTIEIKYISIEEGGVTPPAPGAIFSETFAAGQGDFEIVDVTLGGSLTYVWKHNTQYSCMKASAYANGGNNEAESWLVSPYIDLSEVSSATLTFDHAYKFGSNPTEEMTVWATTSYTGDVATTTWTQLEIPTYPSGDNWTFVNAGVIDMDDFAGEREVVIAFKYMSSSTAAPTWEVKNILIEE